MFLRKRKEKVVWHYNREVAGNIFDRRGWVPSHKCRNALWKGVANTLPPTSSHLRGAGVLNQSVFSGNAPVGDAYGFFVVIIRSNSNRRLLKKNLIRR